MYRVVKDIPVSIKLIIAFLVILVGTGIGSGRLPISETLICTTGLVIACRLVYWQTKYYPDDLN